MNLTNNSYKIYIGTKNFTEEYYKEGKVWVKISSKGNKFKMTAEQVLNHLLPALSGIKSGIVWKVEHDDENNYKGSA